MATLTIELPNRAEQAAFNLRRWSELLENSELGREFARFEGRIETDRHGRIIDGKMTFFVNAASRGAKTSQLCPAFPREIRL